MFLELLIFTCRSSRFTYCLALNVLYSVLETHYVAFYGWGMLAYTFALLGYLPFVLSLARMAW